MMGVTVPVPPKPPPSLWDSDVLPVHMVSHFRREPKWRRWNPW